MPKSQICHYQLIYPTFIINSRILWLQAEILNSSDDVEFNTSLVEENLANLPGDLVPPFNGYAKAGTVEV